MSHLLTGGNRHKIRKHVKDRHAHQILHLTTLYKLSNETDYSKYRLRMEELWSIHRLMELQRLLRLHETPAVPYDAPLSGDEDLALFEANHRISNNLAILASAVSLRAAEVAKRSRDLSADEVSLILGEVSAKISTVAWLHRLLSKEPVSENVDINDHLYRLCETLLSALSDPSRMRLIRTGAGECVVATDAIVPLCLIVTEVVTNSLKYAHPTKVPGKIAVGCHEAAGALIVEVSDDGVGLPEEFDFLADGGTGARVIRALAAQLGAQVSFESRSIGLLFRLRLPSRGNRGE